MTKIEIIEHVTASNLGSFNKRFKEQVRIIEDHDLEVEVHYQTSTDSTGILFSALLIGRQTRDCEECPAPTLGVLDLWSQAREEVAVEKDVQEDK